MHISEEKKALFAGIGEIRDESDRMGMRAVIEVKKDADAEKILQYLYKYSDLQVTFGVNMVAIADGQAPDAGPEGDTAPLHTASGKCSHPPHEI